MLCEECEARFNKAETTVCEQIFLPLHNGGDKFRYGPSFCYFAVSVAWRWLVVLLAENKLKDLTEQIPDQIALAEQCWREYLLDKRRSPAPNDVHALQLDVPVDADLTNVSPHFARFTLRGLSVSHYYRDGAGYVNVKLARLFIFGTIAPGNERREWEETKLHAGGGRLGRCSVSSTGLGLASLEARRRKPAKDCRRPI